MSRRIRIVTNDFAREPALDTAVSRALLLHASDGRVPETVRVHTPGRILAFGKRDTLESGYRSAVDAAVSHGFTPIERLAGGRAAVFTEHTLAFAWTIPDPDPRRGVYARFEALSRLMVRAFATLGIEAETGQIPGEYCPGDYSVHHAGRIKLMGVGQRLARRAAHVGGVVVVRNPELIRDVLVAVYGALRLDWEPQTVGALSDVVPEVTPAAAAAAIRREFAGIAELVPGRIGDETMALARTLVPEHLSPTGVVVGREPAE